MWCISMYILLISITRAHERTSEHSISNRLIPLINTYFVCQTTLRYITPKLQTQLRVTLFLPPRQQIINYCVVIIQPHAPTSTHYDCIDHIVSIIISHSFCWTLHSQTQTPAKVSWNYIDIQTTKLLLSIIVCRMDDDS